MQGEALRLVQLVSAQQQFIAEAAEQVLDTIGRATIEADDPPASCPRLLNTVLAPSPRYATAAVLAPDGHVVCGLHAADIGRDLSDRAEVRDAGRTGSVAATYIAGPASEPQSIGLAKVFRDRHGAVAGIGDISLRLDWLGEQLLRLSLPPGGSVLIADHNGIILAAVGAAAVSVGAALPVEDRFTLAGNTIAVRTEDSARHRTIAYAPPAAMVNGLVVLAALQEDSAAFIMPAGTSLLIALCALGLAALAANRLFYRPTPQLPQAAAANPQAGHLAVFTRPEGTTYPIPPVRMSGLTSGTTAARDTEAALRWHATDLERRLAEAAASSEAAERRAAQAERTQALGQLAGGIVHDFSNVLQVISGAMTLTARRSPEDGAAQRLTAFAGEAIERGISITRRLLAFAHPGASRIEAVDAGDMLEGLREILCHTLGDGITVEVRRSHSPCPIRVDRRQLEIVLINLATNARDAMPEGGLLVLSAEPRTRQSGGAPHEADRRYICLTVADSGTGMDADTLARAREPFFTTKTADSGTGLGLPMAQAFAEQFAGTLDIESRLGQGTSVSLWLPFVDCNHAAATVRIRHARAPAAPDSLGHVLVVDDERMVREVLTMHLEDAGYAVTTAVDGAEALARLDDERGFAALITDLAMPGPDGLAVIRAARQRFPTIPVMLLTGFAASEAAQSLATSIAAPAALLGKPVTEADLLDCLAAMLTPAAAERPVTKAT
jgi:signal transduction histidine kinase/ActR/RegA family two-component response regulator